MKKILSILLAVAMIVSVVSVVSFAADDFKQIIKYDFEDGKGQDGYQGKTAAAEIVSESGRGKVLKFTTTKAWESPYFELGPAIKKAMEDNKMEACTVKVTLEAKTIASDGKSRLIIRGVNGRITPDTSVGSGNLFMVVDAEGNASASFFYDEWEKAEFEFKMDAADVKAITGDESGDTYRMMFDHMSAGDETELGMYIDNITVSIKGDSAAETKSPTGVTFTATNDINITNNEGQYFVSPVGAVSEKDVKDGKLTKTFVIKNNGTEDITVMFRIQAPVTIDGKNVWAGNPDKVDPVVIPAGKSKSVTYSSETDGTSVTIGDRKITFASMFLRFDVYHEDGDFSLPKGTSFTVYCDAVTAGVLGKISQMSNKDSFTIEYSYDKNGNSQKDGDVLPVALIATAVVSAVALVVVSRKKKQEIR